MDTVFATLACCLLALSFVVAQTDKGNLTTTTSSLDLNVTKPTATATLPNSTVHVTANSNLTENTTPFTSTTRDNETLTKSTAATTGSTSLPQTPQLTTIMTPQTNSTSMISTTPDPHTPTLSGLTTQAMQTTGYTSTADTTVITTANSSHTVNTTSDPMDRTTQVSQLNISEKNMTVIFSVVLGVFVVALVVFMFHKCKQKLQYIHQPLNNTDDTDGFVADNDTLVISGGLYDGHPIYDNVPTVSADQSQFRLEFLH